MSGSISYRTVSPVAESLRAALLNEARLLSSARDWWCEPLSFYDDPQCSGHLVGNTKFVILGYSMENGGYREVDPNEDMLMGWADWNFIVTQLCQWSKAHEIEWLVEWMGEPVGFVRAGRADQDLLSELRNLREVSPLLDSAIPEIRVRHAGRMEPGYTAPPTKEPPALHESAEMPRPRSSIQDDGPILVREIAERMSRFGFREVTDAPRSIPDVLLLLKLQTLNLNRALVVVRLPEPPSDFGGYLRQLQKRVAFKCGFFPVLYGIGIQVVVVAPGLASSGIDPDKHVARVDNQWAIIQSVFLVDPSAQLFRFGRTWGQRVTGKYQDAVAALLARHFKRLP